MADRQWTDETEELVAAATARHWLVNGDIDADGHSPCCCGEWHEAGPHEPGWDEHMAEVVLTALAEAGLLLPPGGETRREWAAQIWADGEPAGDGIIDDRGPVRSSAQAVVDAHARKRAANPPESDVTARRWFGNARLMTRTVHVGPWVPVTEEKEET